MKDQYFGDVNDYRKYGLLRALSDFAAIQIGVCWMLTPSDGRADGRFTSYLSHPERWRAYDPPLFDALGACVNGQRRDVTQANHPSILGDAPCFEPLLPNDRAGRARYFGQAEQQLHGCDLVFFDPDNGLEIPSCPIGSKDSNKYLYSREARAWFARGQSLLIYQHFPREKRGAYMERRAVEIRQCTGAPGVIAFRTPHMVFFLVPQVVHRTQLCGALPAVSARWGSQIEVSMHPPD